MSRKSWIRFFGFLDSLSYFTAFQIGTSSKGGFDLCCTSGPQKVHRTLSGRQGDFQSWDDALKFLLILQYFTPFLQRDKEYT